MWGSLMRVPSPVLQAATGIDESVFDSYKKLPLVIAPGTGGTSCMAKCNVTFSTVRAHTLASAPAQRPARRAWQPARCLESSASGRRRPPLTDTIC